MKIKLEIKLVGLLSTLPKKKVAIHLPAVLRKCTCIIRA